MHHGRGRERFPTCLPTSWDVWLLQRWVIGSDNHDTYYVYDNRGNLRFVLPPRIRDEGISQDKLDALAYCYRYDSRDRCVWRKLPGCDAVRYVYDKADRLISCRTAT